MRDRSGIAKHFDFMIIDLLSLTVSFFIAYLIKLNDGVRQFRSFYLMLYVFMVLIFFVYAMVFSPYKNILRRDVFFELRCSLTYVLINVLSVVTVLYLFKVGSMYSRLHFAYTNILYFIISFVSRMLWKWHLLKEKRVNKTDVFVISDSKNISSVVYNIENAEFSDYQIKGIYLTDVDKTEAIKGYSTFSKKEKLYDKISECGVLEVFAYCNPNKIKKTS